MRLICNVNTVPTLGFGDFLRGSLTLYELCKNRGYAFAIDYSKHPINVLLDNNNQQSSNDSMESIVICDHELPRMMELINNSEDDINFTTNVWNFQVPISSDCRNFFQQSLKPKEAFAYKINEKKHELCLDDYDTIHIRGGDSVLVYGNESSLNYEDLYNKINKTVDKSRKILLLSDDINLKRYFKTRDNERFKCILEPISHLALQTDSCEGVITTMIEFFLMSQSKRIYQYTVYSWPSGFSRWCAEIFEIPFISI